MIFADKHKTMRRLCFDSTHYMLPAVIPVQTGIQKPSAPFQEEGWGGIQREKALADPTTQKG